MCTPINSSISAVSPIRSASFAANQQTALNAGCCQSRTGETVELLIGVHMGFLQRGFAVVTGYPSCRVERLREAIENGSYQIDSTRLASNILAFERGL